MCVAANSNVPCKDMVMTSLSLSGSRQYCCHSETLTASVQTVHTQSEIKIMII